MLESFGISTFDIIFLLSMAFMAGLIDSAVGGGGLIQVPALLSTIESAPAVIFGTNKIASISGTSVAVLQYIKKVDIKWKIIIPTLVMAFFASILGAMMASMIPKKLFSPVILFLLIFMLIYTLAKKDFGLHNTSKIMGKKEQILAICFGILIGFYDGIFGPGAGSFLIFLFIRFFSFDFLNASASAKCVNFATNLGSLVFFIPSGNYLLGIGISLAVFNIMGAICGAKIALKGGSKLIRILFIFLSIGLILKFGYGVFNE